MLSKVVLGALLVLACSVSARDLLQDQAAPLPPAPPQCSSRWNPGEIRCQIPCPVTGLWELNCMAETVNVTSQLAEQGAPPAPPAGAGLASCELKRSSGNAVIYFWCPIMTAGMPADCAQGIQPVSAIPDPCVTQNINTIMGAWPPTPSE